MAGGGVRARAPIENLTGEAPVATRVVQLASRGVWAGRGFALALVFWFAALLALAGIAGAQEPVNPESQNESKAEQSPGQGKEQSQGSGAAEQRPAGQAAGESPQPSTKPEAGKKDESSNPAEAVAEATKQMAQTTLGQLRDWETEWLVGAYVSRNRPLVTLTGKQRREIYLQQTLLTPGTYIKRMFDATIDQERGVPAQWDDGWGGYAERWASREGQFIAANSLAALGDAKLGYEPRYDQCRCRGFWPRTRHAVVRNFLTYDRTEQEVRPQWALYGGAFGGGMIATAWLPKPRNAFAEGGWGALGQAGWGVVTNFFTEFAVDINRKLGAKK
jgi:hypothetical protein